MSIKAATPYLLLNGRAEQAIALYERCLGAKTENLQRFGDVHGGCPEAMKSRVMHAQLRIGNAILLMSDGSDDNGPKDSGNISIALDMDNPDKARQIFDALGASGRVIQPLIEAPWGALFGVVVDELGVSWMFNCAAQHA